MIIPDEMEATIDLDLKPYQLLALKVVDPSVAIVTLKILQTKVFLKVITIKKSHQSLVRKKRCSISKTNTRTMSNTS